MEKTAQTVWFPVMHPGAGGAGVLGLSRLSVHLSGHGLFLLEHLTVSVPRAGGWQSLPGHTCLHPLPLPGTGLGVERNKQAGPASRLLSNSGISLSWASVSSGSVGIAVPPSAASSGWISDAVQPKGQPGPGAGSTPADAGLFSCLKLQIH